MDDEGMLNWCRDTLAAFTLIPDVFGYAKHRAALLIGQQSKIQQMVETVAAEWAVRLLVADVWELASPYHGESIRKLHRLLQEVEESAPCVFLFHASSRSRGRVRALTADSGELTGVRELFLPWLDGSPEHVFTFVSVSAVEDLPRNKLPGCRLDDREVHEEHSPRIPTEADAFNGS